MPRFFRNFLAAYPPEAPYRLRIDVDSLCQTIQEEFGVKVPPDLSDFWPAVGSGYFGNRELYFFGDGRHDMPRDPTVAWNQKDSWRTIYPEPKSGGPLFFAENCFGDQLGFHYEGGKPRAILFVVDTFDAFVVADDFARLFAEVLAEAHLKVNGNMRTGKASAVGYHVPRPCPRVCP